MGLTFSTQFHLKWRKMNASNNHEYKFRDHFIFPIRYAFITPSSVNYQNDYGSFPIMWDLYLQLLNGICRNAKEKFNIFESAIWIAIDDDGTRNDPIFVNVPLVGFYTQYHFFFCQEKCYASSKIIYPAWCWEYVFWFPSELVHFHYINLFYVSWFWLSAENKKTLSP